MSDNVGNVREASYIPGFKDWKKKKQIIWTDQSIISIETETAIKSSKRDGTYVYLSLIHVDVWRKPTNSVNKSSLNLQMN